MQLIVGLRNSWKCVEISLQDGCVPVIGGVALPECNIEPALWFKVLVLDCVCVDCSEHVISWSVADTTQERKISLPASDVSRSPFTPTSPTPQHSLMAPHEEGQPSYQDDLYSLFELAEMLFRVSPQHSAGHSEQKSWLRLLHCFLLPPISLHCEDVPSLQHTLSTHNLTITTLDANIMQNSTATMEMKQDLESLRKKLFPVVEDCAKGGYCSTKFLTHFTSDLRQVEEEARLKISTSLQNLALSSKLSLPPSVGMRERLEKEKQEAERELLDTLQLRAALEKELCLLEPYTPSASQASSPGKAAVLPAEKVGTQSSMEQYVDTHVRLATARQIGTQFSRKKVLALSVREALEQTLATLQAGHATTGMDTGLQGGHSTDVLLEASQYAATDEYTTFSEKVKQLLHLGCSRASKLHQTFFSAVQNKWCPVMSDGFLVITHEMSQRSLSLSTGSQEQPAPRGWRRHFSVRGRSKSPMSPSKSVPANVRQMSQLVHRNFQEIVSAICDHFNDHDTEFHQQVWLCYEKLFFETFSSHFISCYESEHSKFCEQLRLNALSASVLPPDCLPLEVPEASWLAIFPPRPFEEACSMFSQCQSSTDNFRAVQMAPEVRACFGPMTSDLYSVTDTKAPLEKLQLLTSAFRKTMASLSSLKLSSLLEEGSTDICLAGVSCDDLLPILVLVLLQLHPSFLALLWLHCTFLEDFSTPFLQAGWHGYSLATFKSALQVISEL